MMVTAPTGSGKLAATSLPKTGVGETGKRMTGASDIVADPGIGTTIGTDTVNMVEAGIIGTAMRRMSIKGTTRDIGHVVTKTTAGGGTTNWRIGRDGAEIRTTVARHDVAGISIPQPSIPQRHGKLLPSNSVMNNQIKPAHWSPKIHIRSWY